MAGGSKLQFGTMAKPLHVGLGAQSGIVAARLAAQGITATPEPLDAPWGFRDLFAGSDSPGFAGAEENIGSPLAILTYGLKVKIYPGCASVHCAVDGVIDLMKSHGLSPDDIQRVDTVVNRVSYDNLMYSQPENEMEARFSMHYCVALAVLNMKIQRSDFDPEAIQDPAVRVWLPRVTMNMPQDGELPCADNGREPAEVHLHLNDGRVLSTFVQHAKGVLQNPLSDTELWAKFEDCTRGVLQPESATRIKPLLRKFGGLSDVGELMKWLRQPDRGATVNL